MTKNIKNLGLQIGLLTKNSGNNIVELKDIAKSTSDDLHQPYYDECCPNQSIYGLPLGFDSVNNQIVYYNPINRVVESVTSGSSARYGLEDSISLQDRLIDNQTFGMAIENTSEFFTGSGYRDTSENQPAIFISDLRTGQTSIAATVTDGTTVNGITVDELGTKLSGILPFTDNTAALAGGLTAGYVYHTAGLLKMVI